MKYCLKIAILTLLSLSFTVQASIGRYDDLTPDEYLKIYQSGTNYDAEKASETLAWAGISSDKLFDAIEQRIQKDLPHSKDNKVIANYIAWMAKGLSFSGNEKYRPTLIKLSQSAPNRAVKKHAKKSLANLNNYAQLNPLIAPKAWPDHQHPNLAQRLENMLTSENLQLNRIASKRIYYRRYDQINLLSAAESRFKALYKTDENDKLFIDSTAWLAKALANTRDEKFKPLLEEAATTAPNKKLRKYIKKYLAHNFG